MTTPIRPVLDDQGSVVAATATATGREGVVARHVVGALSSIDSWDVLLVLGCGMLFAGLWLTLNLGVALAAVGGLFIVGGLMGARGKQLAAIAENSAGG